MNNNDDNDNNGVSLKHHYHAPITTAKTPCNYDKQQQYDTIYIDIARYDCGNMQQQQNQQSGFEMKQGQRFNRQIIPNTAVFNWSYQFYRDYNYRYYGTDEARMKI